MGGRFKNQAVVAAFTAAFLLALGGGAAQASGTTGIDLSTDQAVYDHLRSLGIDPTGVVIQRGVLNYAGPSCPGVLWNCTTATKVAQIGAGGGENRFECEPATVTDETTTCFTMQSTTSGQNHARCVERVTDVTPIKLRCDIAQFNGTGGNHALVRQVILQRVGAHQDADEEAEVTQSTGTGHNQAQVDQDISQFTTESKGVEPPETFEQMQDGTFDVDIHQNTTGGQNTCHLTQFLTQDGRAQDPTVDQKQIGHQDGKVLQNSEDDGEGGDGGGGDVSTTQSDGEGHSTCTAHQRERKTLVGEGTQMQVGPQDCCAEQIGPGTVHIHQDSFARASQPNAVQSLLTQGHFVAEKGSIVHHLKSNEDATSAQETSSGAGSIFSQCTTAFCFSSTDDDGGIDVLSSTVPAEELAGW